MQLFGYQIGNIIGQGGMATVYHAQHILLKQERALKVMSSDLVNQAGFKESFISEGQFIAALKHPHIVTIYDISVQDGHYFMAMEYLQGGSLEKKLPLSLDNAIKVLQQIGGALYYAHQQKIIHRDIKPANILFNAQGDAILTDFGISKIEDTDSHLTKIGYGIVGTVRYMSPEQTGGEKLDQRSDLYSLALVFYEMLSGKKAIKSDTRASIIREHAVAPAPTLPAEFSFLQKVLNKALAKTAAQRYPDMRAFVEAVLIEKNRHDLLLKEKADKRKRLIHTTLSLVVIIAIFTTLAIKIDWTKSSALVENRTSQSESSAKIEPKPEEKKELAIIPKVEKQKTKPKTPELELEPELPKSETKLPEPKLSEPKTTLIPPSSTKEIPKQTIPPPSVNSTDKAPENHVEEKEKPAPPNPPIEEQQNNFAIKEITPIFKTVRVSPYLFIYQQPDKRRIGQINKGTRIEVTATVTDNGKSWSQINWYGKQAYVKTSQLE